MTAAEVPRHEAFRLATLADYGILDTQDDEQFDRITRLAALIMEAPVSAISLVDSDRQWAKSVYGTTLRETPRADAFCAHGLARAEPVLSGDMRADPRFADNPLVLDGSLRSYFGAPLTAANGMCLGMICVAGPTARPLPTDVQMTALADLAALVMRELELHRLGRIQREASLRSEIEIRKLDRVRAHLENAMAARSDFIASLSHELRTPLHGILGFNELIQRNEGAPRDVRAFAGEVRAAGDDLAHTINDVVALAGGLAADPLADESPDGAERADAVPIAADVARLAAGFAFRRQVRLLWEAPQTRWPVIAKPAALKQALLQISINAITACPSGGQVTLALVEVGTDGVGIEIFNTGTPMAAIACAQALTPLGQPCLDGGEGTGISLPIARALVGRLGGTITLEGDRLRGGTRALVTLPRVLTPRLSP